MATKSLSIMTHITNRLHCIYCIMSYTSTNEVYTLDKNDPEKTVHIYDLTNYIGFMTKPNSSWSVSHYVSIVRYVYGLHYM